MTETVSETDDHLILIDELDDFKKHASQIVSQSRRELLLLSHELDAPLYNLESFQSDVLAFARGDRAAHAKILVKEIRPLVEQGHWLLKLARRLPSKIEIRKLLIEPEDEAQAYLMGDRRLLLYKHDDQVYKGFANYNAPLESQSFAEEFIYLWEQHSELDPSLRSFVI